jgi:diguanylate cyclase (GGDEF)-like protein
MVRGAPDVVLDARERAFVASGQPVTMGAMYDFVPFSFVEEGEHRGFVADLVRLLEQKTGLQIEVRPGEWSSNLRLLRERQLDTISDISFKPERTAFTLYTTPYFEIPTVVFTDKSFGDYDGLADLSGKRVGVLQNIFYLKELRSHEDLDVVEYDDYESLIQGLAFGEIDAAIQNLTSGYHYASRNAYTNIKVAGEFRLDNVGREDLRFGVQPGQPLVRSILQKGLDAISDAEWRELIDRWVGGGSMGFMREGRTVALTSEEREYVSQHPVIRVHNEGNYEPFNFYEEGQPRGHSIDLIRLLAEKAGLKVEFVSGRRWDEYLQMMRDGELDVMMNIVRSPEREAYMHFTTPYVRLVQALYQPQTAAPIDSLDALRGKVIVLPDGFYMHDKLSRDPTLRVVASADSLEALTMVSTGAADATIELMSVADHLAQKYGIPNLVSRSTLTIEGGDPLALHIAVQQDKPLLRDILQKAMNSLSEQEKRELQQEWSARARTPTSYVHLTGDELAWLESRAALRVCVRDDRMPFEALGERGQHIGALADLLEIIRANAGLSLSLVPVDDDRAARLALQTRRCDLMATAPLAGAESSLSYTQPLLTTSLVIATRLDEVYVSSMRDVVGKRIGVVGGSAVQQWLSGHYPSLDLQPFANPAAALKALGRGELYGVIDTLPTLGRTLSERFYPDLKISGQVEPEFTLRLAMRADDATLNRIMNKALISISDEQRANIVGRWMQIPTFADETDYQLVTQVTVGTAFVLALILLWNRKLARLNSQIRESNRELQDTHEELRLKNRMLEQLSVTDRLTRLKNRLYIEQRLEEEIARAQRIPAHEFAILLLDVDHFKQVNDRFGHPTGDQVLIEFARLLEAQCRGQDMIARWGGEEFMVICPATGLADAEGLAQRLCEAIRRHPFTGVGHCSASVGVTCWRDGDRQMNLTMRADEALYSAKEQGRDRVCVRP